MNINIMSIFRFLIYCGIVVFPITSMNIPGFKSVFRGVAEEAAFYPIFFGLLFWLIYKIVFKKKIYFPTDLSFKLLCGFILSVCVSGLFNIITIYNNYFRDTYGLVRFFTLLLGLLFYVVILIYLYDVLKSCSVNLLKVFQKLMIASFCMAGFYSLFELGSLGGIAWMQDIMHSVDSLIRATAAVNLFEMRIHSICMEPSMFAIFSSIVMPWIFSGIFLYKNKKIMLLLSGYLFLLMVLSMSRSMYVIFLFEIIMFSVIYRKQIWQYQRMIYFLFVILTTVGLFLVAQLDTIFMVNIDIFSIYSSVMSAGDESTLARYGTQAAAWNMFLSNPFLGVGLGQYAYHIADYMPTWAYASAEISESTYNIDGIMWPLVHGLYARFFGELGFVGVALWVSIWVRVIYKLYVSSKYYDEEESFRIKNLMISLVVFMFFGFMHDSFAIFILWILLGVSMVVIERRMV